MLLPVMFSMEAEGPVGVFASLATQNLKQISLASQAISQVPEVGEEESPRGVQDTYLAPAFPSAAQSIFSWPLHDKWAGLRSIIRPSSPISSNGAMT